MFIVFEGINGSGKTKHVHSFIKELKKRGKKVKLYEYPDKAGIFGKPIKNFLNKDIDISPESQFLLFLADIMKDQDSIKKDLEKGYWVIADRYALTTIAFQRINYTKAKEIISALNIIRPDHIIYLSVSPDIAIERIKGKKRYTRFERDEEFLIKANFRYKELASENFLSKWITIETTKPFEEVSQEIVKKVLNHKH
ncbi:MAG: dTMP kinase [Candidatus Micrarchaeota archaeon]|nr:dTMP kinase [Candidatus Micrarchaeota archaeon]